MLNHVPQPMYEVTENTAAIGKHLVDLVTGEIITPVYEVVNTQASTDDKRFYSATVRTAHECTDPDQLSDVMKATVDQRGLKLKSDLTWFKKESDYRVRTLKEKALISTPQYKFMKQLVECISYKNIILCKRSFLCAKLGINESNLARKLKLVEEWVQQQECKKGFVKLFIAPMLGYKGRASGIPSANNTYYKLDKETQQRALYEPFVGPPAPYTGPVFDITAKYSGTNNYEVRGNGFTLFDSAEDFSPGEWWNKAPKKHEVIDIGFEAWFANNVGADPLDYFIPVQEVWEPDYSGMPVYEES